MRSHVILNSEIEIENSEEEEEDEEEEGEEMSPFEGIVDQSGSYGLRQNPKKTWRFVNSSNKNGGDVKICKECGKGFQSLKALCGHMACHSEKGKVLNNNVVEDHSWTTSAAAAVAVPDQKPVMDSQSDTETGMPTRRRRSKRLRYKTLAVDYSSSSFSVANNNNCSNYNNGSSSVSEIEQEQEEVAMCLMMLSRDSGNWAGGGGVFDSVGDSSDNNSVVLETRSMSIDMRIGKRKEEGQNFGIYGDESVEMKKPKDRKLKSDVFYDGVADFKNFDSGYFRNGSKEVESDAYVDGFFRNGEFKKLKKKMGNGSRFEIFDAAAAVELGKKKSIRKLKFVKTESVKDLINEDEGFYGYGYEQSDDRVLMMKNDLRKRSNNGSYSSNNGFFYVENCKKPKKRSKFECLICNKVFHSPQALGGHIASHKKNNGCFGENSPETDILYTYQTPEFKFNDSSTNGKGKLYQQVSGNPEKSSTSKKNKKHECPVCFKVYRSGQALGGHKRIHMAGGSEVRSNPVNSVVKQEFSKIPDLIDLNLPPPPNKD